MLFKSLWKRLLRVGNRVVIEDVGEEIRDDGEPVVVVSVRLRRRRSKRGFCGRCGRLSPGHDAGAGRRRWRSLDQGTTRAYIEADASRVVCKVHGATVAEVPWARHDVGFTRDFDDQVAWLAVHSSKKAITELMRIAWRTVGSIVERVSDDARAQRDPLDGLRRIGIDEVAYRKGHRYLTVVVDHDTGRLVWAAPGRSKATVTKFFNELGRSRTLQIRLVSADAASWIADVVAGRCLNAVQTMDSFHVAQWATDALDVVRRQTWNEARRAGQTAHAKELKGARYALWRNPEDLSAKQAAKLADIARTNNRLYRAYWGAPKVGGHPRLELCLTPRPRPPLRELHEPAHHPLTIQDRRPSQPARQLLATPPAEQLLEQRRRFALRRSRPHQRQPGRTPRNLDHATLRP